MGVNIAIFLIRIYQGFISPVIRQITGVPHSCRFSPTCSQYALAMLTKHGLLAGTKKAIIRLLSCHPFGKTYGTNI